MKEKEYVKQRIDEAEKELREIFTDLIYEHGDNDGHYELSNRGSGFNTLLKYARKWQRQETGKERKAKGEEIKYAIVFDANKEFKEIRMIDGQSEPLAVGQGSAYVFSKKEFKKLMESAVRHRRPGHLRNVVLGIQRPMRRGGQWR